MVRQDRNQEALIMTLRSDKEHLRKMYEDNSKLFKVLENKSRDFCNSVLGDQHAVNQIGGADITGSMDIFAFMKYALEKHNESIKTQKQLLLDLTDTIKLKDAEIEGLKDQILRYQVSGTVPAPQKEEAPVVEVPKKPAKAKVVIEEFNDDDDEDDTLLPAATKNFPNLSNTSQRPTETRKELPSSRILKDAEKKPQILELKGKEISATALEVPDEKKKTINEVKSMDEIIKDSQEVKQCEPVSVRSTNSVAHVVNLVEIIETITDIGWMALEAIGLRGQSTRDDIYYDIGQKNPDLPKDAVIKVLRDMSTNMKILNAERIACGIKWFYVYDFSDLGKRIFFEKYHRNIVQSEKDILIREHASAKHGYFVKEMSLLLKEMGYKNVCTSRKENRIPLSSDRALIPDIICEKNDKKYYFEMEMANHNQTEFNSKCDRIKSVTNEIYFVVPEANALERLQQKFDSWIKAKVDANGGKSLEGVSIYLGTAKQLKTKEFSEWAYVKTFSFA